MLYLKTFVFIFFIGASSVLVLNDIFKFFPSEKQSAVPAKQVTHVASSTLTDFYQALDEGNCTKAIKLRPGYTLERCQNVSDVTINEVKLKTLTEDTATVYIDVNFKQAGLASENKFVGSVELGKEGDNWVIAENFVSALEIEQPAKTETAKTTPIEGTAKRAITRKQSDSQQSPADFVSSDFLLGKFEPSEMKNFSKIDSRYSSRDGLYMNTEAYRSFEKMHLAAAKDGIDLVIKSAARNFSYQKNIWEGKWTGSRKVEGKDLSRSLKNSTKRSLKILENSSMPGSSRHHWGTDIDLNAFNNEYFTQGKGKKG